MPDATRRRYLAAVGAAASLAGCLGDASGDDPPAGADVVVGPDGRLVFEPATLTVGVGDTVTWYFDSSGHNVSAVPGHSDAVSLPDGADPFASYGPDGHPMTFDPAGGTYEHAVEVPGEVAYVCVPHAGDGMAGRLVVEE